MSVRRILILTNGPLARNPRVVKEAAALGHAGYDVTVITPRNHAPSEPFDAALAASAPFRRVPIDFIPGFGTSAPRVFLRLLRHRLGRKVMTRLGWPNLYSLGPVGALLRAARAHPADLTIVHNEVPHGIGLRLLAEGRRVAADFEDWHSEDLLPSVRSHRPLSLLRHQEKSLLHRATHVTTTSNALADALQSRYGGPRACVITNSFALGPVAIPGANTIPRLLWFSQTIGPGRGLEGFMAAWASTRAPSELTLLGEDSGGFATSLLSRLPASHRSRLRIAPLVAPEALPGFIARHDIGLALENTEPPSRDLTITNKILQYLNAGLALAATPTAGQREVLDRAPAAGILIDLANPAATAAALDFLCRDRDRLDATQKAARAAAENTYCWEREAPRLVALVAAALNS